MMEENSQNKIIERRLTALEVLMQDAKEEIRNIRTNHLEKIYGKLEEIEKQLYRRPNWFIVILCTLVTSLIMYILANK